MDGTRFDQLIKQLGTTRVSRLTALRGLAAGAVASVTGMSLLSEEGEAKKDNPKKRKVCLCSTTGCQTKRVKNRSRFIRRKAPCAYKGKCTSFNPCAAARVGCQFNTDCPAGQVCQNAICVTPQAPAPPDPGTQCGNDQDCAGGLVCRGGRCDFCNNNNECPEDQICLQGQCRGGALDFFFGIGQVDCSDSADECPEPLACHQATELPGDPDLCLLNQDGMGTCFPRSNNVCATNCDDFCGDAQVDDVNPTCVLGVCTVPGDSDACDACGGDNVAGICVFLDDNPTCDSAPPP